MAGPSSAHSSPWPQEFRAFADASPPALSIRDLTPVHGLSPFPAIPEHLSPSYFGIKIEHSSNHAESNPRPHVLTKWRSTFSQSSVSTPQGPGFGAFVDDVWSKSALDSDVKGVGIAASSSPSSHLPTIPARGHSTGLLSKYDTEKQGSYFDSGRSPDVSAKISIFPATSGPSSSHSLCYPGVDQIPPTRKEGGPGRHRPSSNITGGRGAYTTRTEARGKDVSTSSSSEIASPVSVASCAELMNSHGNETLVLDVRPYLHYAECHIRGALSLCIPTTLLKRPSFDTKKLESTFTHEEHKRKFSRWRDYRFIVVYDATTSNQKDAAQLQNILKKFLTEGWNGNGFFLSGGFRTFSAQFPNLLQKSEPPSTGQTSQSSPPVNINRPSVPPVIGGCALPTSSIAARPFFSNIRQNMELVGGVGQIPLKIPRNLTESKWTLLPHWLKVVCDAQDQGRTISEKFLHLEKRELERMRQALSYDNSRLSPGAGSTTDRFCIAGIEKGTKNRYNDIYPFDHSRVRLQGVPAGECDYVNANHIKAEFSNRRYIATQAPVPDTFNDFWRVIWEQDVRVIVTLTAEVERGQVKCHPYWSSGDYGPLKVKCFSQRNTHINSMEPQQAECSFQLTGSSGNDSRKFLHAAGKVPDQRSDDDPIIIVRHFSLSHSAFPFQPLREITQLQYSHWPDFGITSQPAHLLNLIEQCNKAVRATSLTSFGSKEAEPSDQRPVLVHCSAGCGRTGAFCTVDSVLDMLKRQHAQGKIRFRDDDREPTSGDDLIDLVAKTVEDFRTQRPSMVQNLGQFVLCYETVLEWVVAQMDQANDPQAAQT